MMMMMKKKGTAAFAHSQKKSFFFVAAVVVRSLFSSYIARAYSRIFVDLVESCFVLCCARSCVVCTHTVCVCVLFLLNLNMSCRFCAWNGMDLLNEQTKRKREMRMDVPGSRYFLASDSICMVELLGLGTKRLLCQNFVCVRSERTKMFEMLCASGVCVCRHCVYKWLDGVFNSTQLKLGALSSTHTFSYFNIYKFCGAVVRCYIVWHTQCARARTFRRVR